MKPASKKIAPSFDVARDPIADARSGWVYRSDAPSNGDSSAHPAVREIERTTHDETPPAPPGTDVSRPTAPVAPAVQAAPAPRGVPGRDHRFDPDAQLPQGFNWLATGMYLLALPVTLGMTFMFAPVSWMLGARSRR